MQPSDGFWEGIGEGFARADGGLVVLAAAIVVIAIDITFIVSKFIFIGREGTS